VAGLHIIKAILQSTSKNSQHASIVGLLDTVLAAVQQADNTEIRLLGLECLALYSILDKSKQYLILFLQMAHNDPSDEVRLTAIKVRSATLSLSLSLSLWFVRAAVLDRVCSPSINTIATRPCSICSLSLVSIK